MIPGNHDAALAESVWTRAERLQAVPANAHIALKPGVLKFPELGFAVLAAPLTQRHTYNDLTEDFDSLETDAGLLRIGLAHGCMQGILADDIDSANPIAQDRVSRALLDYLALGDWHGTRQIDDRTWYSGTPEPDRYKNNDAGQALLVEIEGHAALPKVEPVKVGQYVWRTLEIQLAVPSDVDGLVEQLNDVQGHDVIRIRISGQTDLLGNQRIHLALSEADGRARSLSFEVDGLRLIPTDEDVASLKAEGYLGEVISELRQDQSHDPETAREALAILAGVLIQRQREGASA